MFGPSYSKQSLSAAELSIKSLDENITSDFYIYKPEGIPNDSEWQLEGIGELLFNKNKRIKAKQRSDFNIGVIFEVCLHHYDGNPKDFERFCIKVYKSSVTFVGRGRTELRVFKKSFNNRTKEFEIGRAWSENYIKRHILNEFEEEPITKDNYAESLIDETYAESLIHKTYNNDTKECPKCAEIIKFKAVICRFCNYDLEENDFRK